MNFKPDYNTGLGYVRPRPSFTGAVPQHKILTTPLACFLLLYKNSSEDEIANVNFLRRYGTYVLQNTKKENLLRLTN